MKKLLSTFTILTILTLLIPQASYAKVDKDVNVAKVQAILAELCYQPGIVDGAWGKKTETAVKAFFAKHYRKYDGNFDVKDANFILSAGASAKAFGSASVKKCEVIYNARIRDSLKNAKIKQIIQNVSKKQVDISKTDQDEVSYLKNQNIQQIMYADARSGYKFVERNVPKRDAFKMVQYEGFPAARIQLSIDMGGARDDWIRDGISGYGQRFEYGQTKQRAHNFNKEIWTRIVFWLPENTRSFEQTTLFDLKEIRNNQTFGPLLNLAIRDDGRGSVLKIKHNFEKNDCIIGRDGSGENSFCDKTDVNLTIGPIKKYTGRWVEFSSRSIWSNESDGAYDAWIDNKKIIGHRGNTSFGADRIAFKFGLYRIGLNKFKNPEDVRIYFSKVGTAKSCKTVGIENCDKLMKSLDVVGTPGASRVFRTDVKQKTEFLEAGGVVLKKF